MRIMAKSSSSTQFRKVDVDQYNEDNYQEEQAEDGINGEQIGPCEKDILNLLNSNKNVDALKLVLKSAPVGCKNQHVKDKAGQLVVRVLLAFKQSEIETAVADLDSNSIDLLMKYIYKGFQTPVDGNCAILLSWHEKAHGKGGVGSIIRTLTDRKQV